MRAKEKHKHTKNDKEKGTGITKYTGQKKIDKGHSIERVWHSASREPSDTLPGSQPCTQKRVASTTFRTLRVSAVLYFFPIVRIVIVDTWYSRLRTVYYTSYVLYPTYSRGMLLNFIFYRRLINSYFRRYCTLLSIRCIRRHKQQSSLRGHKY